MGIQDPNMELFRCVALDEAKIRTHEAIKEQVLLRISFQIQMCILKMDS